MQHKFHEHEKQTEQHPQCLHKTNQRAPSKRKSTHPVHESQGNEGAFPFR